jgi:hypothetical protein
MVRVTETRPEEGIKAEALRVGAVAAGIASVDDVNRYAPEGHRPSDLLKGARSVVVVAGGQPSAGAWRSGRARAQASVGYNRSFASSTAQKIAQFIEGRYGYCAMQCPSSLVAGHYPYASLKLMAEMAGLGTRSMAGGVILNEEYGLLYFGAALTTMPLVPDGPLREPVCPHPACVKVWEKKRTTPCLEACPTCLSGELKGGRIEWMEYRQDHCFPRAQTTAMDIFQKLLLEALKEPEESERKAIVFGSQFTRAVRSIAYSAELSAQCFECLRRCPIGRRRRQRMK